LCLDEGYAGDKIDIEIRFGSKIVDVTIIKYDSPDGLWARRPVSSWYEISEKKELGYFKMHPDVEYYFGINQKGFTIKLTEDDTNRYLEV
jgi:hypothetical protein